MASIHIEEIQQILKMRGAKDAVPFSDSREGYFLEIKFNKDGYKPGAIDEEFKNKVITADCPYGMATIVFNEYGELFSIDLS